MKDDELGKYKFPFPSGGGSPELTDEDEESFDCLQREVYERAEDEPDESRANTTSTVETRRENGPAFEWMKERSERKMLLNDVADEVILLLRNDLSEKNLRLAQAVFEELAKESRLGGRWLREFLTQALADEFLPSAPQNMT